MIFGIFRRWRKICWLQCLRRLNWQLYCSFRVSKSEWKKNTLFLRGIHYLGSTAKAGQCFPSLWCRKAVAFQKKLNVNSIFQWHFTWWLQSLLKKVSHEPVSGMSCFLGFLRASWHWNWIASYVSILGSFSSWSCFHVEGKHD